MRLTINPSDDHLDLTVNLVNVLFGQYEESHVLGTGTRAISHVKGDFAGLFDV